jgi:hypothetical protein
MLITTTDYERKIFSQERRFKGRITFLMNGVTTVYDDDDIIKIRVLEEVSILSESVPSNELELILDNSSGEFDFLNLPNYYEIIASKPEIKVELGLVINETTTEWLPMGTFFMSDWKNENTSKTVSMTANDSFSLLSNVNFVRAGSVELVSLTELLQALFTQANIHLSKVNIDSSLDTILVNDFTYENKKDARSALQLIAIAGRCIVFQDRNGIINIKPSSSVLEVVKEYHSYPRTQEYLFNYPSNFTFPYRAKPTGMRYLDFEFLYEEPRLNLIKSLYELTISIYNTSGEVIDEIIYTQPELEGNGLAFKIDNVLVNSVELADEIADWYFDESLNNITFEVKWRSNPMLESGDVVRIPNSFGEEKKGKIYRQEFIYQGYLEGRTEAKGVF